MTYTETAALLGSISGFLWALALQLVPGLSDWYEKYESQRKAQILFGLLLASAFLVALGSCTLKTINLGVSCTQQGFEQIGIAVVVALSTGIITSQPTHQLAKNALPTVGEIKVDVPPYDIGVPPGIP